MTSHDLSSCLQVESWTPASDVCVHWTLNIYISLYVFRISFTILVFYYYYLIFLKKSWYYHLWRLIFKQSSSMISVYILMHNLGSWNQGHQSKSWARGHINIIFTLFNDANKKNSKFYPQSLLYHVCRYLILKKNEKRALFCPRAAPAEKGPGGQLPPLPPWLRRHCMEGF